MEEKYYVYILTNNNHKVLYVGVTGDLQKRLSEHKSLTFESFTKRYNVTTLIYYETYTEIKTAIEREKQIKSWSRKSKTELITLHNPEWKELEV